MADHLIEDRKPAGRARGAVAGRISDGGDRGTIVVVPSLRPSNDIPFKFILVSGWPVNKFIIL
jgi:hypothetical protein